MLLMYVSMVIAYITRVRINGLVLSILLVVH